MYQDTKDNFQSISSFVKDTEKYVEDVKLNKDKYNNYWIKTIMVNNMSSSISFSGRTSIKVFPTKVSPLLMDEALERKDKTICNISG